MTTDLLPAIREILASLDFGGRTHTLLRLDGPDGHNINLILFQAPGLMADALEGARLMWETESESGGETGKVAVGYNNTAEEFALYLNSRSRLSTGEIEFARTLVAAQVLTDRGAFDRYSGAPDVAVLALDARTARSRPGLFDETLLHEVLGHGVHIASARRRREVDVLWAGLGDGVQVSIGEVLRLVGYTRTDRVDLVKAEMAAYGRDIQTLVDEVNSIAETKRRVAAQALLARLREPTVDAPEGVLASLQHALRGCEVGQRIGRLTPVSLPGNG